MKKFSIKTNHINHLIAFFIPVLIAITSLSMVGKVSGVRFLLQLIALLCGCWIVFYAALLLSRRNDILGKVGKTVLWTILSVFLIFFVLFIIVEWNIVSHQDGDKIPESVDAVLVLGCGLNGTVPSEMLLYRLQAAYSFLSENPDSIAVLCGGQGEGEDITEAECMRRWLTAHGINNDRLFLETKSVNTKENISFAACILKDQFPQTKEVAVISNDFHLFRSKLLCESEGLVAYGVAAKMPLNPFIRINYYLREFASVFFMYGKEIFA